MNGLNVGGKYTPSTTIRSEPLTSKYTIQGDIGRGKFAVVRKCVDLTTGETVAAKVIRKRRKGKSCREEILREVVMLEYAMAHPRLVSLKEVFETPSELILVTEYCSGGELFHECVIEESFEEKDVVNLMVQILEGLCFLHENNIVHLDLKPQNILLTEPFPAGSIKICDLGFACLTNTGEDIRDIIGTPDYVAPEVLDYEPLSIQTDMWSLGVLAYVMLTACSPFAGDNQQETFCNISQVKLDFPEDLFAHISPQAQDFIRKLLVKDPRCRMTARQCFDHEWLSAAGRAMQVSLPLDNKAAALAHDMVPPSNWNPDRRNSTGKSPGFPSSAASATSEGQGDQDQELQESPQDEEDQRGREESGWEQQGGTVSDIADPAPDPALNTSDPFSSTATTTTTTTTTPKPPPSADDIAVARTMEEIGIAASCFSADSNSNSMDCSSPSSTLTSNKRMSMEIPMKKAKCVPASPPALTAAEETQKARLDCGEGVKGVEGAAAAETVTNGGNISLDMGDLTMTGADQRGVVEVESSVDPTPTLGSCQSSADAARAAGLSGSDVDCLQDSGV